MSLLKENFRLGKYRIVALTVFSLFCTFAIQAYGQSHGKSLGRVTVRIPSVSYDVIPYDENNERYSVHLIGLESRQMLFQRRIIEKSAEGVPRGHVDEYELDVRPGIYRIQIKKFDSFKLPTFRVTAGGSISFTFPQFRFAFDEICRNGDFVLKEFGGEASKFEQEKTFSKPPFSTVSVSLLGIKDSFYAVIYSCSKRQVNQITSFSAARAYYKNHYFEGRSIVVDRKQMTLSIEGSKETPASFRINGGPLMEQEKVIFDLRTETIKQKF